MKLYSVIIYSLLLPTSFLVVAKSKKEILPVITNFHVIVFSKDNLLTQRITAEQTTKWYSLLKDIQDFTMANDARLDKDYQVILNASNTLINTLKLVFNSYIASVLINSADKQEGTDKVDEHHFTFAALNLAKIKELIEPLKDTKKSLVDLQKRLKPGLFTRAASSDAMELLRTTAFVLEVTIDKVFIDFNKISAKVNG